VFQNMFGVVGGVSTGLEWISVFFKSLCEACPVCPTYALLQSGHVSLYAPDLLYLSLVWGFVISSFWSVLLVRRVILMCAFLKMFVIYVVSAEVREGGPYMCGFFWFLAGGCGRLSRGGMCVCVCVSGTHCSA